MTRTSTTDPEARVMKMADGGFRPAFNAQVAATTQTRIIVGVDAGNIGSDMAQLPPMLEQIEERLGTLPKEMLADGGYPSQGSLEDAHRRGVTVYAPVQKPKDADRDRYQPLPGDSEARAAWRQRMGTDEAKEIYKERGATIEWVNAVLRRFGLRFLTVRGLKKVRAVLLLAALAHNLFRVEAIRQERAAAAA
jgi:IS5 family transposase